jgi:hypothetical protein
VLAFSEAFQKGGYASLYHVDSDSCCAMLVWIAYVAYEKVVALVCAGTHAIAPLLWQKSRSVEFPIRKISC